MTSSSGGDDDDRGPGGPPPRLPHVLVVEDSPLVSSALRILLEETGRRVTIAASVREAVAALEAASRAGGDAVALMLLDLTLPDGDGTAVLDAARVAGSVPAVTVAMTGHDDEPTRRRCLAAGCAEVLVKPVPSRELLRRVGDWVGAPGA
ncbi:MAG TPA: response regulator [Gemmatimonadaceae bacterium]|nr:response regulator [Gemmatimonadaceae bacterium]